MTVAHWESYYRGGAIAACPGASDGNYGNALRTVWDDYFGELRTGMHLLDIGTGNGALAVIARQVAEGRGESPKITGIDLARIDPRRNVPGGESLFGGIEFLAETSAESLPFEADAADRVVGQFSLEYSDMGRSLAEVRRVLKRAGSARFIVHHAASILADIARASHRQGDHILRDCKVYRRLRAYLVAGYARRTSARRLLQELQQALADAQRSSAGDPDDRVVRVTLDAVSKLLAATSSTPEGSLLLEVDAVERELRHSMLRFKDILSVAKSQPDIESLLLLARGLGFLEASAQPLKDDNIVLAWVVCLE